MTFRNVHGMKQMVDLRLLVEIWMFIASVIEYLHLCGKSLLKRAAQRRRM
jgi:hypothetical protein